MARRILDIDASTYPVYGSEDLAYFQSILDSIFSEVRGPAVSDEPSEEDVVVRAQLAAALFKAAENGERNASRLKMEMLAAVGRPLGHAPRADA